MNKATHCNPQQPAAEPRSVAEIIAELATTDTALGHALRDLISPAPTTQLEDWITGPVVEDMLNISRRTLQNWRDNGTIPFSKKGNKIYYRRSDIEAMLAAHVRTRRKEADHE